MPIVTTTASEYFSSLLASSHFIIILIINMKNTINTALKYQIWTANGLKKISSLILFDGVDSNMKHGLQKRD